MPFPKSPRVVYDKNTLDEVICQLRFPTILGIGEGRVADFQDKIRSEYPLYTVQEPTFVPQIPKELAAVFEQIPKPPGSDAHKFSTKDMQRSISLTKDFISLTESKYVKWDLFREEMEKTERALQDVYSPAFYSRIGLRYRNVISRTNLGLARRKWEYLLQPHIVAELGAPKISNSVEAIETRAIIKIPEVPKSNVRVAHGLVKSPESKELCYIIDADFSVTEKEGINEPFDILDKFNRLAGRLFRWAITDELHNAMWPRPI